MRYRSPFPIAAVNWSQLWTAIDRQPRKQQRLNLVGSDKYHPLQSRILQFLFRLPGQHSEVKAKMLSSFCG